MERLNTRKIDEHGRMVLPIELRKKEKWDFGEKLTFTQIKNVGILHSSDESYEPKWVDVRIDELGRINIPPEIRRELEWMFNSEVDLFADGEFVFLRKKQD